MLGGIDAPIRIGSLAFQTQQQPTLHHKKTVAVKQVKNCHFLLSQWQVGQVLSCITEPVGVKGGFLS
jgi:hypothetical protein